MSEYWNSNTPLSAENLNRITTSIAEDVVRSSGSQAAVKGAKLGGVSGEQAAIDENGNLILPEASDTDYGVVKVDPSSLVKGAKLGGVSGEQAAIDESGNLIVPESSGEHYGVIKVEPLLGARASGGGLVSVVFDEDDYSQGGMFAETFMSKGTLDNARSFITRKALTDPAQTAYTGAEKAAACGTIGAERERKYELIESIRLQGDTASIVRDNLQLKDVYISIQHDGLFTSKWVKFRCDFSPKPVSIVTEAALSYIEFYRTIDVVNQNAVNFLSCKRENNLYVAEISKASNNVQGIYDDNYHRALTAARDPGDALITKLTLSHQSAFAANSVIRIYGVIA